MKKTDKTNSNNIKKQLMIEALTKSLGIVSSACQAVKMSRKTHYEWLKDDPEYKAQVEDIANVELDFVVSKLHKRINEGSDAAIIYYLKCKGKSRGYSSGDGSAQPNEKEFPEFENMTDEQLNDYISRNK